MWLVATVSDSAVLEQPVKQIYDNKLLVVINTVYEDLGKIATNPQYKVSSWLWIQQSTESKGAI